MNMNNIVLVGRLTKDVELKANGDNKYVMNTIAVRRNRKDKNGEYLTDFFGLFLNGIVAENFCKIAHKGGLLSVAGPCQIDKTSKDGKEYINVNVYASSFDWLEKKEDHNASAETVGNVDDDDLFP